MSKTNPLLGQNAYFKAKRLEGKEGMNSLLFQYWSTSCRYWKDQHNFALSNTFPLALMGENLYHVLDHGHQVVSGVQTRIHQDNNIRIVIDARKFNQLVLSVA